MAKFDPLVLTSGFLSRTQINTNFATLSTLLDTFLSLDGAVPSALTAPLDANSQRLINVGTPVDPTDAARKGDIDSIVLSSGTLPSQLGLGGAFLSTDGTNANWLRTVSIDQDDALAGPILKLTRTRAGNIGVDADVYGQIEFTGPDDTVTPLDVIYASQRVIADDTGAGTEDATLVLATMVAGTLTDQLSVGGTLGSSFALIASSGIFTSNAGGPALLNEVPSGTNPTVVPNRADPDTGLTASATDQAAIVTAGASRMTFRAIDVVVNPPFEGINASTYRLISDEAASATNPTVVPLKTNEATGLGAFDLNSPSIVANAVEAQRWASDGTNVLQTVEADLAITASVTQTQGQQPLVSTYNVVTTVAVANDVVTLPANTAGLMVYLTNAGANNLQLFPASGDSIGTLAVDASLVITPNTGRILIGVDGTNWRFYS